MADYAGRLAMCAALDMGVSLVFWQVGAGIVWWIRGSYLR